MASLKAKKRDQLGSRKSRSFREKGLIPGIIYGHGQTPVPVTLAAGELLAAIHHGERLLEVDVDGATENCLIKATQYDAMQQDLIHVDLARVSLDERVEVTVPVVLRGTSAGVTEEGGVLHQSVSQARMECLVTAIPDEIRVSVEHLKVGDRLLARELPLPEGAKLLMDAEQVIASVIVVAEEVAAPAAEEAVAQPEVIGEKKEEEGAEGAPAEAPKKKEKEKEKE